MSKSNNIILENSIRKFYTAGVGLVGIIHHCDELINLVLFVVFYHVGVKTKATIQRVCMVVALVHFGKLDVKNFHALVE